MLFFVQAEDGIRDTSVTGVQTCALPISALPGFKSPTSGSRWYLSAGAVTAAGCNVSLTKENFFASGAARSEERRVGKRVDVGGGRSRKRVSERHECTCMCTRGRQRYRPR